MEAPWKQQEVSKDEAGQQLSKNTRGRIENKPVMGSESGRYCFFFLGGGCFFYSRGLLSSPG